MLEWRLDDDGVHRATDPCALYVISIRDDGNYYVGFFPSPGPECPWGDPCVSLEAAKTSAELCVKHVANVTSQI